MKKKELLGFLLLLCFVLIVYVSFYNSMCSIRDGPGYNIVQTKNQLRSFGLLLAFVTYDSGKKPPADKSLLLKYITDSDEEFKDYKSVQERFGLDPNSGLFLDRWKSPIEIQEKSPREYVLISAGPNQKFEDGKGDDITYSFNPFELSEEKK